MTTDRDIVERLRRESVWPHVRDDLHREAADEITRLRAALAQPQWQPMETAPRDSQQVILLGYDGSVDLRGTRAVHEGRWNITAEMWTSVNGFILHPAATHWMPLPAPPAASP